ncbi:MAG: hypothetical protein KDK45_19840, partial [Leptospiraceae bacterium]|nr:hypothetical protein [Leptospiraceae bacterium]
MKKYLEGSVWHRWDLHIHTKETNKNDQFTSSDFTSYCIELFRKAFESKIYVIGITDYFSIENYKKVVEFQKNINTRTEFDSESKDFISSILLLPNVELRMIPVTDKNNLINIHFLFNPEYVDKLENAFFAAIEHSAGSGKKFRMNKEGMIALGKDQEPSLDDLKAYERGVNSFIVSHENVQKLLDENIELRKNSIIVVSNGEDGVSGIKKHYEFFESITPGSLDALRQSIFRLSDMIFSSNSSDRKYFLGKKENSQGNIVDTPEQILRKCGSLKPCIHGSDAHDESKLFKPDNDLYCWIKAIPTFNGLKQVIYEPEDRVIIQKNNPYTEYDKPHFSFVKITNSKIFSDSSEIKYNTNEIPLNKNLVAIIGGRGTGKSLFLDSIARTFKKTGSNKRINEIIISPENFLVTFNKEDDEK